MTGSEPHHGKFTRADYHNAFMKLHAKARGPTPQDVSHWILVKRNRRIAANTIAEWLKSDPVIPRKEEHFLLVLECLHALAGESLPLSVAVLDRWRQRRSDAYAAAHAASTSGRARQPDPGGAEPETESVPLSAAEAREVVVVGKIPAEPAHFVAREQLRKLAETAAASLVSVVVTGMRGVGKTQLAAAYARQAIDGDVGLVAWVDAETDGALLEGLAAIASRLGVADPDGDSQRSAHRLRDHLTSRSEPGVLVFDNATAPDRVRDFVPVRGGTRVIITSTDHAFTTLGTLVDLEVYTRLESVSFLNAATGLDDDYGADRIARELGDLPLALTQAAATISIRRLDYTRYQQLLDEPLPAALTRLAGSAHPHRVDKAILLSLETTEASSEDPQLDTAVRDVLELIAMLAPAGVRVEILPDRSGRLHEALARCEWGSLLTRSTTGEAVVMHRLISRVLRERAASARPPAIHRRFLHRLGGGRTETGLARLASNALTVIENNTFAEEQSWQRRDIGAHLIEHIDAIWNSKAHTTSAAVTRRLILSRDWAARQLINATDTTRAVSYTYQTLADVALTLGTDHREIVIARGNLARAYQAAGRVTEAVSVFEQCLADAERIFHPLNPAILGARRNLANAYRAAGRPDEAIPLYQQILTRTKWIPNIITDPLPRTTRSQLAAAYRAAGRPDEAIPLYQQALTSAERLLGPDHPHTLSYRSYLASAYQATGRVTEAVAIIEQCLATRERIQGAEHPETLTTRANLAHIYQTAGRIDEAIHHIEQTLAIRGRVLGPEHPDTLTSCHNLAHAYLAAGRIEDAIALLEQTIATRERVLSPEHPDTLGSRMGLAYAYLAVERIEEAIALFEQTSTDSERIHGPEHPNTLSFRNNLASAYMSAGRASEAIELLERNLTDRERVLGVDHPDTLTSRKNLASAYEGGP